MVYKFIKNNSIMLIYAITLLSMFVFLKTAHPVVNYVRYAYVLFMGAYIIFREKSLIFNRTLLTITICFLGHTVLFGFLFVPEEYSNIIIDNAKDMLLFWGFVIFTAQYVWKNGLEKKFLIFSQIATTLFMNYCYITNFNGIGPIKFLPALFGMSGGRIRFTFGLSATNRAAYIALAAFILSVMVWRECFKDKKLLSLRWALPEIYVFASGLIAVLVMLSTQTRGAIIAAVMFWVLTKLMNNGEFLKVNFRNIDWKIYYIIASLLLGLYAYFVFFNAESRSEYMAMNLDVFLNYSEHWKGLGYVPFSGFLTQVFGYETGPLDCYYLYIICTTGIVGAVMVLGPIIFLLFKSIKTFCRSVTDTLQNQYIGLYIICVFIAFSESSLVAPYSPYSYIYWVMFFLLMTNNETKLVTNRV